MRVAKNCIYFIHTYKKNVEEKAPRGWCGLDGGLFLFEFGLYLAFRPSVERIPSRVTFAITPGNRGKLLQMAQRMKFC